MKLPNFALVGSSHLTALTDGFLGFSVAIMSTPEDEANQIIDELMRSLPSQIDGKSAIQEMMNDNSANWRQMEWIGFWFEHFVEKYVSSSVSATAGPAFGRTRFDLKLKHVWDLKAHPDASPALILNDKEAVLACIEAHGGLGFIVLEGTAEYDSTGEFKAWHDELKGGKSAFEQVRIAENRPSRRRKASFTPKRIVAIYLDGEAALDRAVNSGWLGSFQTNMRNSNGNPRRPKFMIGRIDLIPDAAIVARRRVT